MHEQSEATRRGIGLRCSRETRGGGGAKGNAGQSDAAPEGKRLGDSRRGEIRQGK